MSKYTSFVSVAIATDDVENVLCGNNRVIAISMGKSIIMLYHWYGNGLWEWIHQVVLRIHKYVYIVHTCILICTEV